jgi:hypothetical protein
MKIEFSGQVFEKYSSIQFHEYSSSGSRVVPSGQTDRVDEANSRFSQFYEGEVVSQMPGYTSQRRGSVRSLPN